MTSYQSPPISAPLPRARRIPRSPPRECRWWPRGAGAVAGRRPPGARACNGGRCPRRVRPATLSPSAGRRPPGRKGRVGGCARRPRCRGRGHGRTTERRSPSGRARGRTEEPAPSTPRPRRSRCPGRAAGRSPLARSSVGVRGSAVRARARPRPGDRRSSPHPVGPRLSGVGSTAPGRASSGARPIEYGLGQGNPGHVTEGRDEDVRQLLRGACHVQRGTDARSGPGEQFQAPLGPVAVRDVDVRLAHAEAAVGRIGQPERGQRPHPVAVRTGRGPPAYRKPEDGLAGFRACRRTRSITPESTWGRQRRRAGR